MSAHTPEGGSRASARVRVRYVTSRDEAQTYLRVAAAADHATPLGHADAGGVLDQQVVCSADVSVSVASH